MTGSPSPGPNRTTPMAAIAIAWLLVSVPLLWGVLQTIKKAVALFE